MIHSYSVTRLLQEQSGSYFVTLPKLWVKSLGLSQSDELTLIFNGIVKIIPPSKSREVDRVPKQVIPNQKKELNLAT